MVEVALELITELVIKLKAWVKIQQLKKWVEIQQLKELKVFNSLKLSIVVAIEVLMDIFADILIDITMDIITDITNRTELKAWVKIQQPKEFKVLLITVYYWDSLKS